MKFTSTEAAGKLLKLLPADDPLRLKREKEMAKIDYDLERELHDQIIGYLSHRLVKYFAHQPMNKRSQLRPGTPDFMFVFLGEPVAVEAKIGDNVLSDDQVRVRDDMLADGWTYCVARSVEDVKKCLDQISLT